MQEKSSFAAGFAFITFNEDVENYDKWRLRYCKELFNDIIQHSELNKNKKARSWRYQ